MNYRELFEKWREKQGLPLEKNLWPVIDFVQFLDYHKSLQPPAICPKCGYRYPKEE